MGSKTASVPSPLNLPILSAGGSLMYLFQISSTAVPSVYPYADSRHAISMAMLEAPCSIH